MDKITYQQSGVDISLADKFVSYIMQNNPKENSLWKTNANYASVYPLTDDLAICLTTDGVGSKVLIASELDNYDHIGIDLVAMCVNDLLCVGAQPKLFLDYYAFSNFNYDTACKIIDSIIKGCKTANCSLVGGETAQMPDLYAPKHFDLAGFSLGIVNKNSFIDGHKITNGNTIIGIAANGIHSNGLSLARKLITKDNALYANLLKPTHIYTNPVLKCLDKYSQSINGIAHITGGGITNLFRLNNNVGYQIDKWFPLNEIFQYLAQYIEFKEMHTTFNMGYGMYIIVNDHANEINDLIQSCGFKSQIAGLVNNNTNQINITHQEISAMDFTLTKHQ